MKLLAKPLLTTLSCMQGACPKQMACVNGPPFPPVPAMAQASQALDLLVHKANQFLVVPPLMTLNTRQRTRPLSQATLPTPSTWIKIIVSVGHDAELEESEVLGPDEHRFDAELLLAVWAAGRWGESEV